MNPASLFLRGDAGPQGVAGSVVRGPSDGDSTIDVRWEAQEDEVTASEFTVEPGVRWFAMSTPSEGDDALLIFDSNGTCWALVWTGVA